MCPWVQIPILPKKEGEGGGGERGGKEGRGKRGEEEKSIRKKKEGRKKEKKEVGRKKRNDKQQTLPKAVTWLCPDSSASFLHQLSSLWL